jgi:hypothetical protein
MNGSGTQASFIVSTGSQLILVRSATPSLTQINHVNRLSKRICASASNPPSKKREDQKTLTGTRLLPKSIHDAFDREHWSERADSPDTKKPKLYSKIDIVAIGVYAV